MKGACTAASICSSDKFQLKLAYYPLKLRDSNVMVMMKLLLVDDMCFFRIIFYRLRNCASSASFLTDLEIESACTCDRHTAAIYKPFLQEILEHRGRATDLQMRGTSERFQHTPSQNSISWQERISEKISICQTGDLWRCAQGQSVFCENFQPSFLYTISYCPSSSTHSPLAL